MSGSFGDCVFGFCFGRGKAMMRRKSILRDILTNATNSARKIPLNPTRACRSSHLNHSFINYFEKEGL